MMDQRINSAVYVKVLKRIHEFPTEHWPKKGNGRSHEAIERSLTSAGIEPRDLIVRCTTD